MDEGLLRFIVGPLQVGSPTLNGRTGLDHDRFTQWVMAADEELVSRVEPLKVAKRRYASTFSAVAFLAREHEVPHAIDGQVRAKRL